MNKEIKIEIAKSKCEKTPSEKEFDEFFETKRDNHIPEEVALDFDNNK